MNRVNRRRFLQLASAGSAAAAAGVGLPGANLLMGTVQASSYTFRAVAGLPEKPLPSYASYVIEGHIDLKARSGTLTKMVFAGNPEAMSNIALPGLSRVVCVTGVRQQGHLLSLTGVVADRSQLHPDERATVEITIDQSQRTVQAHFLGSQMTLRLI